MMIEWRDEGRRGSEGRDVRHTVLSEGQLAEDEAIERDAGSPDVGGVGRELVA